MKSKIFDIKRDARIEKTGGFWCRACLVGRPAKETSPDPRYCQGCYELLLKEAEADTSWSKKDWAPKRENGGTATATDAPETDLTARFKCCTIPTRGELPTMLPERIMQRVNGQKSDVCIIQSVTPKVTRPKRGPKHIALPIDLIIQYNGEGMASRAIAAKLEAEQGIKAHYSTISRILSGQRILV